MSCSFVNLLHHPEVLDVGKNVAGFVIMLFIGNYAGLVKFYDPSYEFGHRNLASN